MMRLLLIFFVMLLPKSLLTKPKINYDEAQKIATEAYIWGYPLVVMQRTKQEMTQHHPLNSVIRQSGLVTPGFSEVVTPNVDTLYAAAWLDLQKQPLILAVPDTRDRYYSVQFLDAYTNTFSYVGKRATGTKAGKFIIAGPHLKEKIDFKLPVIQAPTNTVWLIVRIGVKNDKDLPNAKKLLDQITLSPLYGSSKAIIFKAATRDAPKCATIWHRIF